MRSLVGVIITTLVPIAALGGCADELATSETNAQAIAMGVPSTNTGVVVVVNPDEDCSGYLIAPNLVLTARHCVTNVVGPQVCETYTDATGTTHPATTPSGARRGRDERCHWRERRARPRELY